MPEAPALKYIKGFDGLRAISIIMVFVTHLGFIEAIANPVYNWRVSMLCSGNTGVNIFFVLSGFLITRILLREKLITGRISLRNFYIRRFLRLLPPLIIFYAAIIFLMGFGFIEPQWFGLTLSVFYLYNFVPHRYYSGELGPTWSLALEEQYYIFWPFVVAFFRKYIPLLVLVILILCIVAKIYIPGMSVHHNGKTYPLNTYSYMERWFFPAVAPIMIGALSSFIQFNNEPLFRKYFSGKLTPALVAAFVFFMPAFVPVAAFRLEYMMQLLQVVSVAVLLIWILYNQQSVLTRVLDVKPLAYIGKISYGLYVYHGIFIRTGRGDLYMQQFPLNLFLTVLVAIVSYEFYEKKILKLKSRFHSDNNLTQKILVHA